MKGYRTLTGIQMGVEQDLSARQARGEIVYPLYEREPIYPDLMGDHLGVSLKPCLYRGGVLCILFLFLGVLPL